MGSDALQRQRGYLLLWAPVFLGAGIGLYFVLLREPGVEAYAAALAGAALFAAAARYWRHGAGPLFAGFAILALGFCLAGWRAHNLGGPVLEFRYYGAIEGRVVAIDRSASDKLRVTFDRVHLEDLAPWKVPTRVRVSLHGQGDVPLPAPGSYAMVTGHLSPPPRPSEPHGFDFERYAWFNQLGAVGYARTPVLEFEAPETAVSQLILRARLALSASVQRQIGGDAGAVAAAVTTGDRSGMTQNVLEDLRGSNLAHLLAISGLHMGLLTGFVFWLTRLCLALYPPVALRWPTQKIAAATALVAGAAYLLLSGGAVATERAFVMAAVVFGAVILGRRALTLRAVAVAALMVLALQPEALMGPGFQMSFAATTALVVTFRLLADRNMFNMPRWLRPPFTLFVSSAVAGLATAPFAAAHFNIIAHYGLVANLLSVPVMGAVVMPSAVVAALLSPLGLSWIPLWVMEQGLSWILWVADWVSGLEGAVGRVHAPPPEVLPMLALGGLAVALWRGRERMLGAVPVVAALALWAVSERPDMLVSPSGGLVGLMGVEGRVMSKPRGDGFVASSWLENDGDDVTQDVSFSRGAEVDYVLGDVKIVHVTGKSAREATCSDGSLLIVNQEPQQAPRCMAFTPESLRETGAVAMRMSDGKINVLTTRDVTGWRLWNDRTVRLRFAATDQ